MKFIEITVSVRTTSSHTLPRMLASPSHLRALEALEGNGIGTQTADDQLARETFAKRGVQKMKLGVAWVGVGMQILLNERGQDPDFPLNPMLGPAWEGLGVSILA